MITNFQTIAGAHILIVTGSNNHVFNFDAAYTFTGLLLDAVDRYEVRAKAPDSLVRPTLSQVCFLMRLTGMRFTLELQVLWVLAMRPSNPGSKMVEVPSFILTLPTRFLTPQR